MNRFESGAAAWAPSSGCDCTECSCGSSGDPDPAPWGRINATRERRWVALTLIELLERLRQLHDAPRTTERDKPYLELAEAIVARMLGQVYGPGNPERFWDLIHCLFYYYIAKQHGFATSFVLGAAWEIREQFMLRNPSEEVADMARNNLLGQILATTNASLGASLWLCYANIYGVPLNPKGVASARADAAVWLGDIPLLIKLLGF